MFLAVKLKGCANAGSHELVNKRVVLSGRMGGEGATLGQELLSVWCQSVDHMARMRVELGVLLGRTL